MKRLILAIFVLLFGTTACTNGYYYYQGNGYWVSPAITGYGMARPYYYYQPPPVYVQPTQRCELRSEVINGQVVQGNFCY